MKSAIDQMTFIFYYFAFILSSLKLMIDLVAFSVLQAFLHFPNLLKNVWILGLSWGCKEKMRTSNKWKVKTKQNFLLHPVASCTSSVYFWFLIKLVSQVHANIFVYMHHSKHKNIKLFGSFPFQKCPISQLKIEHPLAPLLAPLFQIWKIQHLSFHWKKN